MKNDYKYIKIILEGVVLIKRTMIYSHDARKSLEKGMYILFKAVGITLGPKGKNVILGGQIDLPKVVNDGVTIAKEIEMQNHLENIGVKLMKQVALKTNDIVGDGTTTSVVLAYAIIKEGMKSISAGANSVLLRKGMEKSVHFIIKKIAENSRPIMDVKDIVRVASISAGNNNFIGEVIAEAILKVGQEGVISLEEGESTETLLDIKEGMNLERGYFSSSFLSHNKQVEIKQDNPWILLTDQKITKAEQELIPLLEQVAATNRPLLIMAEDIKKEALSTLIINRLKGVVDVVAVRIPGFGERRKAIMEDLSVLTNASIISQDFGLSLDKVSIHDLGSARCIKVSKNKTTIISSNNNQSIISHCETLRKQVEFSRDLHEKEILQERLAKLTGGIAVIKVGAATTTEMHEKKLRLEDAINATRAAIEEGIVPGGGSTLAHLSHDLYLWSEKYLLEDERLGAHIIAKALSLPLYTIVENTGSHGSLVLDKLRMADFEIGYDANADRMVNMHRAGIIDPAKVTRLSLQNALSIASIILTTECVISDRPVYVNL